jgi:hypothetical protein
MRRSLQAISFFRCGAATISQLQQATASSKRKTSDKSPRPHQSVIAPVARRGFVAAVFVLVRLLNYWNESGV